MNSKNKKVDLNKYLDEYIDFIIENDVDNFFELDVDIVMGLDWVEKARKKIEERTGKKVIPVWHKQRGIQYFEEMCRNYSYVAIGGIVTGEIKKKEYPAFKKLIRIAHENGAKIHGLGFTSTQELHKYHFDSVDSTSWISGGRFGQMQIFKDGKIKIEKPQNKRAKYKEIDEFNFNQWIKFQDYADVKL